MAGDRIAATASIKAPGAPLGHTDDVCSANLGANVSEALRTLDPAEFTSLHILDRVPALFESREQYAAWRFALGAHLDVDPLCLVVVGSTAVGVSLSPTKLFQAFHDGSDVDVAVISPRHFDAAWRYLRSLGPLNKLKNRPEAELLKWHRRSLVFDGTIHTDGLLPYLSFGAKWQTALGHAARRSPTEDRDVKARIYRDFESLREYHCRNVESLRASLVLSGVTAALDSADAGKV